MITLAVLNVVEAWNDIPWTDVPLFLIFLIGLYWVKVKMDRGDCNHWYTGNRRGFHAFYSLDIGDIIDDRLKEQNSGIVL